MNNKTNSFGLLYLYCITSSKPDIVEFTGCIDVPFYIPYEDFFAVVSYVSTDDFSKEHLENNLLNPEWLEKKTRIHDNTINDIMGEFKQIDLNRHRIIAVF